MKLNSPRCALLTLVLLVGCVIASSQAGAEARNPGHSAAATSSAGATHLADISGSYLLTGTNEDGSPYKGALEVIKHGDVYQFRWNAGKQYDGVGVQNGNVVAVAFTGGTDGKGCGVVSYKMLGDGTLDGRWGYWGINESGTERAVRSSGSGLAGQYNVTGSNPDGTQYKARLAVAPKGGGYTFAWSNDSNGFGVRQGNTVSVGIGGDRCAFVAYEIKADGTLDGIWGGYGSDKTGTEKATKQK